MIRERCKGKEELKKGRVNVVISHVIDLLTKPLKQ